MSKTRTAMLGLAAAATFAAFAGVSLAQPPQPKGPDGPPPPRPGAEARMDRHDPAKRAEMLREKLKLTSAQEPAFQAWIKATARPEHSPADRAKRDAARSMTTPQRLDEQLAQMNKRDVAFKAHADATKRFYAALTAEQKTQFDQMRVGRGGGVGRLAMGPRGGGRFEDRGRGRDGGRDHKRDDRGGPDAYQPQ